MYKVCECNLVVGEFGGFEMRDAGIRAIPMYMYCTCICAFVTVHIVYSVISVCIYV